MAACVDTRDAAIHNNECRALNSINRQVPAISQSTDHNRSALPLTWSLDELRIDRIKSIDTTAKRSNKTAAHRHGDTWSFVAIQSKSEPGAPGARPSLHSPRPSRRPRLIGQRGRPRYPCRRPPGERTTPNLSASHRILPGRPPATVLTHEFRISLSRLTGASRSTSLSHRDVAPDEDDAAAPHGRSLKCKPIK